MGILLIYLSIFVRHRRRLAAYASSTITILTLPYLFSVFHKSFVATLLTILIFIYVTLILVRRKEFSVRNNFEGIWQHLQRIGAIAIIGIFYGIMTFYLLGPKLFHSHFSLIESFDLTLDSLTGFSGTMSHAAHLGSLFIASLGGIGLVVFILLLGTLFRPLRLKLWDESHEDRGLAKRITAKRSASSEDFFKLWPMDKQYYFTDDRSTFLAYKQSGRTIIILSEPVGLQDRFDELISGFFAFCFSNGWRIAAIQADETAKTLYERHGLSSLFIGNEAVVEIAHFTEKVQNNKDFRYVRNRAVRDGLTVMEWTHPTKEQFRQLESISNSWLGHGRREYTFFMGYFDPPYLEQGRIFVVLENDRPTGYINLVPSYIKGHHSIDHLRSAPDANPVSMKFLLMSILQTLSQENVKTLNLGLSPLSGAPEEASTLSRVVVRIARTLGPAYYSFKGLEQFKNKFRPAWSPRFVLYSGSSANLLPVVQDIERASTYLAKNVQLYVSTVAGVILLTLGLYFIIY
jgi:phosphatidylglycerol lysyltransferase